MVLGLEDDFSVSGESNKPVQKRGRGRPKKSPKETMVQRNVSLTPQDDAALNRLADKLQLSYYSLNGEVFKGVSVSWALRALIRLADKKTKDWEFPNDNDFLIDANLLGMMENPYENSHSMEGGKE